MGIDLAEQYQLWRLHKFLELCKMDDLIISMVLSWITAIIFLRCVLEEYGACDSGYNGGLMTSAFEHTLKAGGLEKEKDYPYIGTDHGTCKFDKLASMQYSCRLALERFHAHTSVGRNWIMGCF